MHLRFTLNRAFPGFHLGANIIVSTCNSFKFLSNRHENSDTIRILVTARASHVWLEPTEDPYARKTEAAESCAGCHPPVINDIRCGSTIVVALS